MRREMKDVVAIVDCYFRQMELAKAAKFLIMCTTNTFPELLDKPLSISTNLLMATAPQIANGLFLTDCAFLELRH